MTVTFKLENVVPWGRSLAEYVKMFNLTDADLKKSILDCAGGPSSFNAKMTRAGNQVISCDPIYQLTVEEINGRIQETYPVIINGLKQSLDKFVWQSIQSPEHLGEVRIATMKQFLEDFPTGVAERRYLIEELPHLPWEAGQFDIALCGHFLFTYSEQFSLDFHLASILEMCRVAKDVRIFPLLENFTGETSLYLEPVRSKLVEYGYKVAIEQVNYEFQRNGNQMLRVNC